ncbi:MAG: hypothetical protein PUP92_19025 [Rhizonema sp. PD38]|nr:hypothetical protein [Rhizonema sp. PD38]
MLNHSIKTTIGVIKYHVKELLGLADTALVKKWALKQGLGRLDMRRKSCWRLVLEAIFIKKGRGQEAGGIREYWLLSSARSAKGTRV